NIENVDSVTSKMARVSNDTIDWSRVTLTDFDARKPVVLNVWKKGAFADIFLLPSSVKRDENCLIVPSIDDFGRLTIQSNHKNLSWYAFWQNVQIPVDKLSVKDSDVILPVPVNSKSMEESIIRVIALGQDGFSNELFIPVRKGKVLTSPSEASYDSKNILQNYLQRSDIYKREAHFLKNINKQIADSLQAKRAEWTFSQSVAQFSDNDLFGIVKTYMNNTSILVTNPYPINKVFQIDLPENIKIGNLKSHLGNSIKQSGKRIVITMKPHSSEIVTSEIY
ncbi:MAG: hypothetical protein ACRC26_02015, partial [Bacteroidales bacterium]